MKDDIFHNEDRTKFFDFIIPVVPYIDATNSGEYLKHRLDEIRSTGMEFDITDEYIMNVAPFISDMRVLNSICNEFIVFKKTIKDSQDLGKLQDIQMLSIMIFKNMYPEEFALLQGTEGIIKKAYTDRNDFIKVTSADLQKEIEDAEEERRKSDSQEMLHAEDVKLAFIQKIVGDRGVFTKIQGTKGNFTRSDILKGDFSLAQIGVGAATVYYRQLNYYSGEYIINEIEKVTCSDGVTYYEKCDRAIARDKKRRKQIAQNLLDKQRQLYELRSKPMKMLIKEYGADEVLGDDVRKNKLLVFMLRHDEKKVVFLNRAEASRMTDAMYSFVKSTNVSIPKRYLQAAWNKLDEKDRPEFMVKHFSEFTIIEIQNMFMQMPKEYNALRQEGRWHEALLEKNAINESLCKKLLRADYISSYDIKKEKNILFTGDVEKYVARVKAKR